MVMENGEGHGVASDRLPAGCLVERGGSDNPGFVRVVCPHSVASAGLVHALEEARTPSGPSLRPGLPRAASCSACKAPSTSSALWAVCARRAPSMRVPATRALATRVTARRT
jgi:hypothetical protein